MKAVISMTLLGVAIWIGSILLGVDAQREVRLGVLCPLLVTNAAWVLMERTYKRRPQALTSTIVAAFGFKLVFFGAYLAVMLRWLSLQAVPFVVSFMGSFVALHLMEALFLRHLLQDGIGPTNPS